MAGGLMENKKLIYASEARRAVLKADPKLAYCIDSVPGVDAVEVVRCKECVSGHTQYYGGLFRCNVMGCSGLKADDFCSYGERKK